MMEDSGVSPLKLGPSSKRQRLSIKCNGCVICQQSKNQKLTTATDAGIKSLVNAANARNDEVSARLTELLGNLNDLQSPFHVSLSYHRGCMASYTSKRNLSFIHARDGSSEEASASKPNEHPTRLVRAKCDWTCCVICSQKCYKKDSILHRIVTTEKDQQLKKAAETLQDHLMLLRIQNEDLFAKDARYHHYCMNNYLYKAASKKDTTSKEMSSQHDVAFKQLLHDIEEDLLLNQRVFLMSDLLKMFQMFLPVEIGGSYSSQKLQNRLVAHYGESVSVLYQKAYGQSNLLLSSAITLNDALVAVRKLKQDKKNIELEQSFCTLAVEEIEQMSTLHAAAGILRAEMEQTVLPKDYPTSKQVLPEESAKLMPSQLSMFLEWLVCKQAYDSAQSGKEVLGQDMYRKCLAITECILSCSNSVVTPLQLGLAVQFYHEYGSRKIIETLSSYGFSSSYDELRRFLTSVAQQEATHIQNGTYVPSGIIPVTEEGNFIHEGDDNVDINTETIDGKNTFHSMARVIFQESGGGQVSAASRIKRVSEKSLKLTAETEAIMQTQQFEKPLVKPEPSRYEHALEKIKTCQSQMCPITDLAWVMLRMLPRNILPVPESLVYSKNQVVPFWTGFNHRLSEQKTTYTTVAYAPIINAKPSDMETVYTTMKRCKDMSSKLGQEFAVQTMDQQLYAVAQQVKWSSSEEFNNHFIHLGGFHTLSCYIAAVGKIWGDGGLRDLMADSGVYAPCTVDQMLGGKQFNRAVRGLTLVYEALTELWMDAFLKWCKEENHINKIPLTFWEQLTAVQTAFEEKQVCIAEMLDSLQSLVKDLLEPLMKSFNNQQCQKSATFKFWNVFLNAVQIMLLNIRAVRTGDWDLTLQSQSQMLPYLFVSDRMNYSRWLPVYILDMLHLPDALQSIFRNGQFSVRQRCGRFNGIWSDMGTEKTVIKDCKGQGGIGGLTQQKSALIRWSLTRHILGEYASSMHQRAGIINDDISKEHDESHFAALKRDEEHVNTLTKHLRENMTDPFNTNSHPDTLVNISTGLHASTEVQASLLTVTEKGQLQAEHFIEETLETDHSRSLYNPITKSGLKTFTSMTKKTKLKSGGVTLNINISPELVFRRALTLSSSREEITAKTLLSHPIGPVPTSMFHDDGSMRRCTKADLGHKLEEKVARCKEIPSYDAAATVTIRDVMAVLQALPAHQYHTFDDLAFSFFNILHSGLEKSNTIIDVYDQYDKDLSVKSAERNRRAAGQGQKIYQVIGGRAIPPWKKFLAAKENKNALQLYLSDYIVVNAVKRLINTPYKLYIVGGFSNGEEVKSISGTQVVANVEELYSSQEEADTRIFLHAFHINGVFKNSHIQGRIIIKSPDTDVLVLAVHYFPKLNHVNELWIQTGTVSSTTDHRRYIAVHEICKSLSPVMCDILPAMHALTGCDTTSSFFGIGKRSVFKTVNEKPEDYTDLLSLSGSDQDKALEASRKLILKLYSPRKQLNENLDGLRLKLASQKNASLARLPPCEKSFMQHFKRTQWQTKVWTNSHIPKPDLGSPLDYGWKQDGSSLLPIYYDGPMASELLQDLICSCRARNQCNGDCTCKNQNLPCTD